MVDAADREKVEASRNELHNLLDKPQLQGIPVRHFLVSFPNHCSNISSSSLHKFLWMSSSFRCWCLAIREIYPMRWMRNS